MVTNVSWDICPGFTEKRNVATLSQQPGLSAFEASLKKCGSLRETARRLSISCNTVRKWVKRHLTEGEAGLVDRSRRPHHSPRSIPPEVGRRCIARERSEGIPGPGGKEPPHG